MGRNCNGTVQGGRQTACVGSNWGGQDRVIERSTMTEAKMIVDLLVQIAVAAVVLAMVVFFVVAQDPRRNTRDRVLRHVAGRHRLNRTRHGF